MGVVGVTAIETNTTGAAVTFKVVDPEIAPCVAVMLVVPPVKEPAPLAVAPLIVANEVFELFQTTEAEISAVEALLYVPVATKVCEPLCAIVCVAGVTAIETSTTGAAVTFNVAVPLIAPCVAVIVVAPPVKEPAPFAVAPVIVASDVLLLVQVTDAEISALLALL